MPVTAGVDGCKGGWIAAVDDGAGEIEVRVFGDFAELLAALPADAVIAVDMPIGLPDHCGRGGRGPEALVRPLLGARQSSVFSVPSRSAVHAVPDEEMARDWYGAHRQSSAVARQTSTPPKGVSIQGFGLFRKIRELDGVLRSTPGMSERVLEAHPELAFWRMNGRRPLNQPKKVRNVVYEPGMAERRALLLAEGLVPALVASPPPAGAGADDKLDALAVLTVARRAVSGRVERLPSKPERDAHRLTIAIHF